ncbi:MAG: hypothetical protein NTY15_16955 [Planctomycetota bacterium]|nr:hypothetical protein [Planctomycetota bacterium]
MRCQSIWVTLALVGMTAVLSIWPSPVGNAQEQDGMPRLTLPDKTPDVLYPGIQPDAFLIRNGMGETILVPKVRYEAFERFLSSESDRSIPVSAELLEQLAVTIRIEDLIARIQVNASANLAEANSKWLSVPIALGNVQATPNQNAGESESEFPPIRVASDRSGYVWRLSPGGIGKRSLKFDALSNVRSSPQGSSLRLDLPSVPSLIRIALPSGQWELNIVGNGSEVVEPFVVTESDSTALVRTSGGSVALNWVKKTVDDEAQAIEVKSQTKYVPLTESGQFRVITNLNIRGPKNLGGRRFLLMLPEGSQWREPTSVASSFLGFRVSRSEQGAEKSNTVLMLEFEEAFSRMELELPIEWQSSQSTESNLISFFMPRVEGVQRHTGSIDLSVPRNVSFQWEPQAGIQFVKQTSSNDGSESLMYSFGFSQQDEPLVGKWIEGDVASELQATYNVVSEPSILRLSGSIEFLGDVRQLPFLQLDVRGWTVDRVRFQPSGQDLSLALIQSRTTPDPEDAQQSTTSIPLNLAELLDANQFKNSVLASNRPASDAMPLPADPNATMSPAREEGIRQQNRGISFVLSRANPPEHDFSSPKQPLVFTLPLLSWLDPESQQRESLSVGGDLTIQSTFLRLQEGETQPSLKRIVESIWRQGEMNSGAGSSTESARSREELRYRVTSAKSWLEWNGSGERLGSVLQTRCETKLHTSKEGLEVYQTWTLSHADGVSTNLRLALPKDWFEEGIKISDIAGQVGQLDLSVDGEKVAVTAVANRVSDSSSMLISPSLEQRYLWMRIALPESKGNSGVVREQKLMLRKRIPLREKLTTAPSSFEWLLPWVGADRIEDTVEIVKFAGTVVSSDETRCSIQSPVGGDLNPSSREELETSGLPFDRTNLEPRLVGLQSLRSEVDDQSLELDSMWLQTIVNAREQRDRFVYRIKTKTRVLSFRMPASQIASAEFLIDGKKILGSSNPNDVQRIDLALDAIVSDEKKLDRDVFVVEIFLWSLNDSQWWKSLRADSPTLLHCRSRSPLVWQVVLPTTVHLVGNTSTLSPGYRWKWQDLYLKRSSDWDQEKIGNLIGATPQRFVSEETNQYVFFSLDHTVSMKVWAAPRFLLWAPVALFVLIGSFFVMEFAWIKRPWVITTLLLVSLVFSQWAWDLSIALVQCLIAAIGIAVMYSTLKWVVDRKSRRRSVFALRPGIAMNLSAARAPSHSGSDVFAKAVASTAASPGSQLVAKAEPPIPQPVDSGVSAEEGK